MNSEEGEVKKEKRKMTESPLMIKSKELALEVIRVCKELRISKCESTLINQFLRLPLKTHEIKRCNSPFWGFLPKLDW